MAVSVLEYSNGNDLIAKSSRCLAQRRHYKKDSRFVLDLYTLTYDSHESLDSLGDLSKVSRYHTVIIASKRRIVLKG